MFRKFSLILICIIAGSIFCPACFTRADSLALPPRVLVSAEIISQADTFLIVVKDEVSEITGSFGSVKLHFFRNEDNKDWIAITGAPLNKTPGEYKLSVSVPNKAIFEKNITVVKRSFLETKMVVTKELAQKGYTSKNIINNIINIENKSLAQVLNVITPVSYITKPFVYPVFKVKDVGSLGNIRKSQNYKIQHLGVDLEAPLNTPIYAVNDGKVVFVRGMTNYGNTVIVDHGLGVYSLYLHLNRFDVREGQIIKLGDNIGLSGNTGYSIAPHLHFSITMRGVSVDPLRFIWTTQGIKQNNLLLGDF
jgi:murein DD-endopeptidase MepM/ murein hydrolase activator NlpD